MALFKILRGESTNLADVQVTDGFAYFTPENGKFYIDYGNSGDNAIFGRSSTDYPMKLGPNLEQLVPNRICINDNSLLTAVDDLIGSVTENIKITDSNVTIDGEYSRIDFPDLMEDLFYQKRLIGLQVLDNGVALVPNEHYFCDDSYGEPQIVLGYKIRKNSLLTITYEVQYLYIFDQLFKLQF